MFLVVEKGIYYTLCSPSRSQPLFILSYLLILLNILQYIRFVGGFFTPRLQLSLPFCSSSVHNRHLSRIIISSKVAAVLVTSLHRCLLLPLPSSLPWHHFSFKLIIIEIHCSEYMSVPIVHLLNHSLDLILYQSIFSS